MPKSVQSKAKKMIQDIYMAEREEEAWKAYRLFIETFEEKYQKAVEVLRNDEEHLFSFYGFPAKH